MLMKLILVISDFKKRLVLFTFFNMLITGLQAIDYATAGVDTWDVNGAPPSPCTTTITINHSFTNGALPFNLDGGTLVVNAFCNVSSFSMNASSSLTVNSGGTLKLDGAITITGGAILVDVGSNYNCVGSASASGTTSFVVNGTMGVGGNFTNSVAITGNGSLIVDGTLDESGGGSHGAVTLPVELIDFSAIKESSNVVLNWSTAVELNSDYYLLLRSSDSKNFEYLGKIGAVGNSSSVTDYEFVDASPVKGVNYYQLVETDKDGATQTSKIIAVDFSDPLSKTMDVYPNPSIDDAQLFFTVSKEGLYSVSVSDIAGRVIYKDLISAVTGENKLTIPLRLYISGVYWVVLVSPESEVSSLSVLKK